ncbi:MAG: YARHG domain-containing protein [Eubacteriales bacterium]
MNQEQQPCFCVQCGNMLEAGAKFCNLCGTPYTEPPEDYEKTIVVADAIPDPEPTVSVFPPPPTAKIFCAVCGSPNDLDAFCGICGSKLVYDDVPLAPPAVDAPPAPPVQPVKKKSPLVAIIALLLVLLLGGGGWFAYSQGWLDQGTATIQQEEDTDDDDDDDDEKEEDAEDIADTEAPEDEDESEVATEVATEEAAPTQLDWQMTPLQAYTSPWGFVNILTTITDENGQPIQGDLQGATLSATEEIGGNLQEVPYVASQWGTAAFVALCVDVSASAQGSLLPETVVEAFSTLPTGAGYAMQLFGEGVSTYQPVSYGAIALSDTDLTCWDGTQRHLLDGMVQGIADLSDAVGTTKHLIVIADGGDDGSTYPGSQVADLAEAQGVSIHLLVLGSANDKASVENLANQYGWDYTQCTVTNLGDTIAELSNTYAQTALELWYLGYETNFTLSSGEETTVTLTVTQDDLTTQATTTSHFWDGTQVSFEELQVKVQEDADFIFADSDTRLLTDAELQALPLWDLYIARNEIYARLGRRFTGGLLQSWFNSKDWYQKLNLLNPTVFDSRVTLSNLEQQNIELISTYEASWFDRNTTIFPDGATVEITSTQQTCMSTANLQIALNQLKAMSATTIRDHNIATITAALAVPTIQY